MTQSSPIKTLDFEHITRANSLKLFLRGIGIQQDILRRHNFVGEAVAKYFKSEIYKRVIENMK